MKSSSFALRVLLAWIVLVACRVIAGILVPIKLPLAPHAFAWAVGTDLVSVAVLAWAAVRSGCYGWRLGLALFAIPFGITATNLIEGIVYLGHLGIDWRRILVMTFVTFALAAPLWTLLFGNRDEPKRQGMAWPVGFGAKLWRFVLSDLVYLIIYLTAGIVIFPYVKNFYATQTVPSFGRLVGLQLAIRGPAFVAICLLFRRMLRLPRATGALAVGAAFTLLSGVAPLIVPSGFFPDAIRWVHFCEVVSSNFLFGAFAGWLWGGSPKPAAPTAKAA